MKIRVFFLLEESKEKKKTAKLNMAGELYNKGDFLSFK